MAALTVTPITKSGVDLTASLVAADVAGDTVVSSSGLMFYGKNADTSPHTITISAPVSTADCGNYGSVDIDDIVITLPANTGEQAFTVPLGYASSGVISLAYDAVTSVTIGVFSLA